MALRLLAPQRLEDRNMLNTILIGIMRNALLVLGIGALAVLNTAVWGG
jgi:hypothetical protein